MLGKAWAESWATVGERSATGSRHLRHAPRRRSTLAWRFMSRERKSRGILPRERQSRGTPPRERESQGTRHEGVSHIGGPGMPKARPPPTGFGLTRIIKGRRILLLRPRAFWWAMTGSNRRPCACKSPSHAPICLSCMCHKPLTSGFLFLHLSQITRTHPFAPGVKTNRKDNFIYILI